MAFVDALLSQLSSVLSASYRLKADQRRQAAIQHSQSLANSVIAAYEPSPIRPSEQYDDKNTFMKSGYFIRMLAQHIPNDSIIFDEALTNSPPISYFLPGLHPGQKMMTRGGSLGTGFPGAIGAKLAHPDKTVIGFSGDGGSMYTIQCLWTASRHGVAAKFVVCQNRSYRLLQANISQYWTERGISGRGFPSCFDLSYPQISFDTIAHSLGVAGERVWNPDQVLPAIQRMLDYPGPYLINLVLEGDVHPDLVGVHCGQ